jgi:hypothetical protein
MSAALSASRHNLRRKRPPFGWVWCGGIGGNLPRQGIRCLLQPDQIFPAAKCVRVETQTAAKMGSDGNYIIGLYEGWVVSLSIMNVDHAVKSSNQNATFSSFCCFTEQTF